MFSDITATSLKSSTFLAYPMDVIPLSYKKEYKKRLIQSGHSLLACFRLKLKRVEVFWERKILVGGLQNLHMGSPRPRYWMLKNKYRGHLVPREKSGRYVPDTNL